MNYNIIAILVRQPSKVGEELQNLLGLYGNIIRTRLGLHREETAGGVILLDLTGEQNQINSFIEMLNNIQGIEYKHVVM